MDAEKQEKPQEFEANASQRIAVAVASPILGLLCVGGVMASNASFGSPSGADSRGRLSDHVVLAAFTEMFVAFLILLALAFIWAVFRPAWTIRLLRYASSHVWHALLFFLGGFGVSFVIVSAVTQ
jgi:hypothetical protein